ncbi:MAG TPA: ferritin [bacterium]|nr:ferritin [bacterium]
MIDKKLEKMINDQINYETYSAYIYLAMGAYFDAKGLPGFANWMKVQWQEELFHAKKMYLYLLAKGGRPFYIAIPDPGKEWKTSKAAFEHALKHENSVTARINAIKSEAMKLGDHATSVFYNWYVNEQVEEEKNVTEIIQKIELLGNDGQGIYLLDKELAARVFVEPPLAE